MSRTKNLEKTETENTVSENLVEQTEIESVSAATESVKETLASSEKSASINKVATVSSVKGNKRMGVNKFLQFYPQNIYVEALFFLLHSFQLSKNTSFIRAINTSKAYRKMNKCT